MRAVGEGRSETQNQRGHEYVMTHFYRQSVMSQKIHIEVCVCVLSHLSYLLLFVTIWAVVHQALLSTGFPRQEYWSGLPLPSPGDLPNQGIEPESPALAGGFFTTEPPLLNGRSLRNIVE